MKRRRRNPQARNPQDRGYHTRSLLREALVQKLELDFMVSRQYRRSERSKTWQSSSSSDSQESSAALSLDKYVKAFITGDKCTEEKEDDDDASGNQRPRRDPTPVSEDFDTLPCEQSLVSSSPLHMSRIEECSASAVPTSDEHDADSAAQHGHHRNHHQPPAFQIRGQGGGWEHARVLLGLSSRQSLVSEDTVHRLGMSLAPVPPMSSSRFISTCLGPVEFKWWTKVEIRTSADMLPVSVDLASTKSLPVGTDILIGRGLFDILVGKGLL